MVVVSSIVYTNSIMRCLFLRFMFKMLAIFVIAGSLHAKESIGILGGAFNPVHNAHLRMAIETLEQLILDEVWLMPNYDPPFKRGLKTSFKQRLTMVEFALDGLRKIKASDYEKKFKGPSFTSLTVSSLSKEHPEKIFYFIVGMDAFSNFTTKWTDHKKILQSVNLVLINRPGYKIDPASMEGRLLAEKQVDPTKLDRERVGQVVLISIHELEMSSTEIREKISQGLNVAGLMPKKVIDLINDNKIYVDELN
jgi:nicotinate-nucleotide adenylyltransferase